MNRPIEGPSKAEIAERLASILRECEEAGLHELLNGKRRPVADTVEIFFYLFSFGALFIVFSTLVVLVFSHLERNL